jgi:hypothetical protein
MPGEGRRPASTRDSAAARDLRVRRANAEHVRAHRHPAGQSAARHARFADRGLAPGDQRRRRARCSRLSEAGSRAASRRDSQLPGVLPLQRIGCVPKRCGEAISGELGILSENLFVRGAACGELEQELDTEPSTANARLAVQHLRVGDDQVFGDGACPVRVYSSATGPG